METSNSQEPSCVSMKSDWSMDLPQNVAGGHISTDLGYDILVRQIGRII